MTKTQGWLEQALAAHQAEKWADAEALYRKILDREPRHVDAHALLGALLLQTGRYADSARHLVVATEVQPGNVATWINLGSAYHSLGQRETAITAYQRALASQPDQPDALLNLAAAYAEAKNYSAAEKAYRQVLVTQPNHPVAGLNLARVLLERGDAAEAQALLESLQSANLPTSEVQMLLGHASRALGDWRAAVAHYAAVVAREAGNAEASYFLGAAKLQVGDVDGAISCLREALRLREPFAQCHAQLALALARKGDFDAADGEFQRAVSQKPNDVDTLSNYSEFLLRRERFAEAQALAEKALAIAPTSLAARCNLAAALYKQGQFTAAQAQYRRCLEQQPDYGPAALGWVNVAYQLGTDDGFLGGARGLLEATLGSGAVDPQVHWSYALHLLRAGRLQEGWREYEWGFALGQRQQCSYPFARWRGEPLNGKTILVHAEQGVGDQIMFASMYPDLVATAGKVVLHVDARMVALLQRSFPSAIVEPYPPDPTHYRSAVPIDFYTASGSMAQYFRGNIGDFPVRNVFLRPDARRVAYWRERLARTSSVLNVGFAWRSGVRDVVRNLSYWSIEEMIPLLQTAGVQFVNVQYGDCGAELETARSGGASHIVAFPEVDLKNDFCETAALLAALDVVIAPAIATYALAAAVGTPTWLVGSGGYMEFGTAGVAWFPTVRLFHRSYDDWPTLLGRVQDQLQRGVRIATWP